MIGAGYASARIAQATAEQANIHALWSKVQHSRAIAEQLRQENAVLSAKLADMKLFEAYQAGLIQGLKGLLNDV